MTSSAPRIAVDPKDGNLFVAVGDRSTGDPLPLQAQHLDTYLGKVIHITPEGKPAPGNPSLGLPGTWSMGHRTPQGLTFAPDGRLWEVEHGPRGGDELNLIERGKNYGWPVIVHGINYPGTKIGDAIVENYPASGADSRVISALSDSRYGSAAWSLRRPAARLESMTASRFETRTTSPAAILTSIASASPPNPANTTGARSSRMLTSAGR